MNNNGDVTGYYIDSFNNTHGFVRSAAGSYTSFDAPGAKGATTGVSINDAGDIAGSYQAGTLFYGLLSVGFVRGASGGFTTFSGLPDSLRLGTVTYVHGINNAGAVAGY